MNRELACSLWEFSVNLYCQPGIEALCLQLQDEQQVPITLLLFICWLDCNGKTAAPEALTKLLGSTTAWHQQVVQPLRAARRWIKLQAPLDELQTECREQIKTAELAAERWELQRLEQQTSGWRQGAPAPQLPRLRDYLATSQVAPPLVARALALLQGAL